MRRTRGIAVKESDVDTPSRGMTMDQVASKFGAPVTKVPAVGKPPISRWEYPGFVVYFEHEHVIHSVVASLGRRGGPCQSGGTLRRRAGSAAGGSCQQRRGGSCQRRGERCRRGDGRPDRGRDFFELGARLSSRSRNIPIPELTPTATRSRRAFFVVR